MCVELIIQSLHVLYTISDIIFIQFGNRLKSVLQLIPQFDSMEKVTQRRSQRVHVVNYEYGLVIKLGCHVCMINLIKV